MIPQLPISRAAHDPTSHLPAQSGTLLDRTGAVVSRADGFDATTARAAQQVSRAGIWPAPSANREGAVLANIKAGQFTVVGRPLQASEQGDLLTEACVLDGAIDNFSVLAVLRGSQADIVGVGVAGRGGKFLVRAVGPSLGQFGIPSSAFCRDPILEFYDSQGRLVSRPNAGASGTAVNSAKETGAFPLVSGSADVATIVELPLGGTTLHIRSSSGQGGLVLVEL